LTFGNQSIIDSSPKRNPLIVVGLSDFAGSEGRPGKKI
jgi:hypothetical protein